MKSYRVILTALTVMLLLSACLRRPPKSLQLPEMPAESKETSDFRAAQWGMSWQEVRDGEKEGTLPTTDVTKEMGTLLVTDLLLEGVAVNAVYSFTEDALVSASYLVKEEYDDLSKCTTDYRSFRDSLCARYGEPKLDAENWNDEQWKDSPDDHAKALAAGHVSYIATWETEATKISLYLAGADDQIKHFSIGYIDKNAET